MERTLAKVRRYDPIPDSPELGKHMRALNPKQRAFVAAYVDHPRQNQTQAARAAGYGDASPTEEQRTQACKIHGSRLIHDPKVLAAVRELAQKRLEAGAYLAANVLVEIADDPTHKDRLKAAESLMNRAGMIVVNESKIVHEHQIKHRPQILERIREIANRNGLDAEKLIARQAALPAPAEDATFEDAPSSEGLEDLL